MAIQRQDGRFTYSYRLKAGVNRQSHAIVSSDQLRCMDHALMVL